MAWLRYVALQHHAAHHRLVQSAVPKKEKVVINWICGLLYGMVRHKTEVSQHMNQTYELRMQLM